MSSAYLMHRPPRWWRSTRYRREIWRAALPASIGPKGADGAGYSSAVISNGAGVKQYVQLMGRFSLTRSK